MEAFINEAFENGIQAFSKKIENQPYSVDHEFELVVVEFLVHLYGKTDILNPYLIKNDNSLKDNLTVYGATEEEVNRLFDLLGSYGEWLKGTAREKNTILEGIFAALARLVVCKTNSMQMSDGEMKYYQDFFALTNKRISQLVDMMAQSREAIVKSLATAVEENKLLLTKPKNEPELLTPSEYDRYGLDIEEVKALPPEKIKELNQEIKSREESGNNGGVKKADPPKQLVLSSGNGFVDALVLFSIMCTEIMVGIIITVIIARF